MSSDHDPARPGRELARRHGTDPVDVDETLTLLQVAESPRGGDWTLRSALVRFAQPQPELAGAILESVRRTQAALDPLSRVLLRNGAPTDRGLTIADDGGLAPVADPLPDARATDLARLVRAIGPDGPSGGDGDVAVEAYDAAPESEPLEEAERQAIPLLVVMLDLDELAQVLTEWAPDAPENPPVYEAKRLGRMAFDRLASLGVAREQRQAPPRGGRSATQTRA